MCLHPQFVRNPNYGRSSYASQYGTAVKLDRYLFSQKEYISVPCGRCADCRSSYYNSILQRALVESLTSYVYFVTLTYDNEHLPVLTLPSGQDIYYSDYNDIQLMFKRFRDSGVLGDREFRYLCATEYGDSFSRPHFHLLIFVAKKTEDDYLTPLSLERTLFDNLQRFYARNVGSRKHPVYEKLFTYAIKYTTTGVKTNYFVSYVKPSSSNNMMISQDTETLTKTIRYLIGYVNKGSAFDSTVESLIEHFDDELLVTKLRNILRSKLRFSKGFGFGFTASGRKDYMPKICVKASSTSIFYTDFCFESPRTFDEFSKAYPHLISDFKLFIKKNKYQHFTSLDDCIKHMTSSEYFSHCILVHYFPSEFSDIYCKYYRTNPLDDPKISYFFNHFKYKYNKPKVQTTYPNTSSVAFRYLRSAVDDGLRASVPYLAFRNVVDGSFTSLCKFYKDRVCTLQDIATLFYQCKVNSYDEWSDLFQNQLDLRKAHKVSANNALQHDFDDIICKSQKEYLNLPRRIVGVGLYTALLGKR